MSKVIKNSIKSAEMVAIKTKDGAFPSTSRTPKKPEEIKTALNFKGTVDAVIGEWERRISGHFSEVEQSVTDKVDDAGRRGYKRGFSEGVGKERADREKYIDDMFGDRIKVIEKLLREAKEIKANSFRGLEKKLVAMAMGIAEIIIKKSIDANPEIVETIVDDAMSHFISGEKLILKVSAEDYKVINAKYDKWFGMAGNVKEFKIEIDKRLTSGDCLIETEGGDIDASISSRLDILTEELMKVSK